jgi:hypothetical protein
VKTSSRWLLIFGVTIGVLVIAAVVLVLTMSTPETRLLPENTPEGIVQRYFLALEAEDYVTAYSYLSSPTREQNPYEMWRGGIYRSEDRSGLRVTLGKSVVTGNEATIEVTVDIFRPGGPFGNPVDTYNITFFLKKEGTSWKITSPPYVGWFFY